MKNLKLYAAIYVMSIFAASCVEDSSIDENVEVQFPDKFSIDIPEAISSSQYGKLDGRLEGDGVIQGNEIYQSVPYFINIGEESAKIVEFILKVGHVLEQLKVTSYAFVSEEDGRNKLVKINHNVTKGGVNYQYEMIMYDVDDDVLALQLVWNTNPVIGIAILSPYNINRIESNDNPNSLLKVEYTEDDPSYDATMLVSISGLVVVENGDIDNLKLFVGKKGDLVDVIGNSNHPKLKIIDPSVNTGRNYAFVGRGDYVNNIGVIKLALPPSNITIEDVFTEYNVYDVLEAEINSVANLDAATIEGILREAHSPAYFNYTIGFINSGENNVPTDFNNEFVDLSGLLPFAPKSVRELVVDFIRN